MGRLEVFIGCEAIDLRNIILAETNLWHLSMYRVILCRYQSMYETYGWTKLAVNLMWSIFV